jgi:hypothetical protein
MFKSFHPAAGGRFGSFIDPFSFSRSAEHSSKTTAPLGEIQEAHSFGADHQVAAIHARTLERGDGQER